jgi:regulator of replication initiation timing
MKKTSFTGMVKATASEKHPAQQHLSFIFTDYLPNKNKQGVPRTEAANILATAVNQPVKISYKRKPGGHLGAIPIGPITFVHEAEDHIEAEAVVWRSQCPDVAAYLEKASAEAGGVQFSWELLYESADIDESGVSWLKGIVVDGITIVDNPAYAGRTPLLALAEEESYFMDELQKKVDELSAQLATLTSAVAEKEKTITDLQSAFASLEKEHTELKTEAETLRTFKAEAEANQVKAETLAKRKSAMSEAGLDVDDATFTARESFYLSMADDTFTTYVQDLVAVAKTHTKKAEASDRIVFPDPITRTNDSVTTKEMAQALRSFRGK